MNKVIINADDFAQTVSCTEAIKDALVNSIITDTTMVANGDAFDLGIKYIREYSLEKCIGIHFVLTEGTPLTEEMKTCTRFVKNGYFIDRIRGKRFCDKFEQFRPLSQKEKNAIYLEWKAQIDKLLNAGVVISHADSHHHVHTKPVLLPIFIKICKEYHIKKVRIFLNANEHVSLFNKFRRLMINWVISKNSFIHVDYFCSSSEARAALKKDGTLEIMTHPDYDNNHKLIERTGKNKEGFPTGYELKEISKSWEREYLIKYIDL